MKIHHPSLHDTFSLGEGETLPTNLRLVTFPFMDGLISANLYLSENYLLLILLTGGKKGHSGDVDLSEYETRRKSNIWDSDIDRGISVIYNGGKSNISSSEREYLVEKAVKDGINWTAGSDEDKREFFKEILNGNDESALADIWHMYDYKYRKRGVIEGDNWKDIFSEDYINYYEEKIFQTKIRENYLSYNSFEYESLFKDGFQKICDTINSDFDRGARGTHFVKVDNYERTEKLADELKRVDIDITYILLNLKRFKAEDVTEKLMGIFREAKREGERLKEKYGSVD